MFRARSGGVKRDPPAVPAPVAPQLPSGGRLSPHPPSTDAELGESGAATARTRTGPTPDSRARPIPDLAKPSSESCHTRHEHGVHAYLARRSLSRPPKRPKTPTVHARPGHKHPGDAYVPGAATRGASSGVLVRLAASRPTSRAGPPRLRADSSRGRAHRRRGSRGRPARPRSLATCRARRAPRRTP